MKTCRMRSTGAKVGIAGAATAAPSPAGSLQRARRRRRRRQVPFPHGWTSGWAEVARPWEAAAAAWTLRGPRTMAAASSTAYSPLTMSRYGGAPVLGLPDPDPLVRGTDPDPSLFS